MKRSLLFSFIIALNLSLFSQQFVLSDNLSESVFCFNPAVAGIDNKISLTEFSKINNYPFFFGDSFVQYLGFDMPINSQSSGVGFNTYYATIGSAYRFYAFNLAYSYHFSFEKLKLSFGLSPGMIYKTIDLSNINYNDIVMLSDDPKTYYNIKTGLHLDYLGFFIDFTYTPVNGPASHYADNCHRRFYHDFNSYFGYDINIKDKQLFLTPSVKASAIDGYFSYVQFGLIFSSKNKFSIGLLNKGELSIYPVFNVNLFNKLILGASYEYIIEKNHFYKNTLEVFLKYSFNKI